MSEPASPAPRTHSSLTLSNPGLAWLAVIAAFGLIVGAIVLIIVGSGPSDTIVKDISDSAATVYVPGEPDPAAGTWLAIGGWLVQIGTMALVGYLIAYAVLRRSSPRTRPDA